MLEKIWRFLVRNLFVGLERMKGNETSFYDSQGPIQEVSWAKFIIDGKEHSDGECKIGVGKDIRCIGKEVTEWKDRNGHLLTPEMVTGVFDQGVEILIIGLGICKAIKPTESLVTEIKKRGIPEVLLESTPVACRLFNEYYRRGRKVALLAHGTC